MCVKKMRLGMKKRESVRILRESRGLKMLKGEFLKSAQTKHQSRVVWSLKKQESLVRVHQVLRQMCLHLEQVQRRQNREKWIRQSLVESCQNREKQIRQSLVE